MASPSNNAVRRIRPTREDWARLRPAIEGRYRSRQWTMQQLCDYMTELGYHTTPRMVKARLGQWNLQKNHRCRDLVSALQLLNGATPSSSQHEVCFQIGERRVLLSEIVRFFRRKGIRDPIQWARSQANPGQSRHGPDGPRVQLVTGENSHHSIPCVGSDTSFTPSPLSMHESFGSEEKALTGMREYCVRYLNSELGSCHKEPSVHQFTIHGRFGDRMQEGVDRLTKQQYASAFESFKCAFDLVRPLLSDCHPMGISQYLTIVCEIAAKQAFLLLESLLRYTNEMASTLGLPGSLQGFLSALQSAPDTLPIAVASLRMTHESFTKDSAGDWRTLYVTERLCDGLYHDRSHKERSALRAQLLSDQEAVYGHEARNVLWTLTNVADDQFCLGEVNISKEYYELALNRAEQLRGFGRAKIRFAAHEGLARVKLSEFDGSLANRTYQTKDQTKVQIGEILHHLDCAAIEASTWFDSTSRRLARVHQKKEHVINLIECLD